MPSQSNLNFLRTHFSVKIDNSDNRIRIRCQNGRFEKYSERYVGVENANADIERWRSHLNKPRARGASKAFVKHDPPCLDVPMEVEGSFTRSNYS